MNDAQGRFGVVRLLVRTMCSQRVKCVGHGNDAWQLRNCLISQPAEIPTSIERFMVKLDAGNHVLQLRHWTKNVGALGGVGLHDLELFWRQRSWFCQDAVFNADLADVMKLGGYSNDLNKILTQSHLTSDQH